MTSFSKRHGFTGAPAPITVREDAPERLRYGLIVLAKEYYSKTPSNQREILCQTLKEPPDPNNWSEYPNIENEVQRLMMHCDWYRVYDIAEAFYKEVKKRGKHNDSDNAFNDLFEKASNKEVKKRGNYEGFESELNDLFVEEGIGWKMKAGRIVYRGEEPFEHAMDIATKLSAQSDKKTATSELREALKDLSRRPDPDRTGAIHHAMGALECFAREITGNRNATLGEILKRDADQLLIQEPMKTALEKLWGYASDKARHIREGDDPTTEEAEYVATVAAATVSFLIKKHGLDQ